MSLEKLTKACLISLGIGFGMAGGSVVCEKYEANTPSYSFTESQQKTTDALHYAGIFTVLATMLVGVGSISYSLYKNPVEIEEKDIR